MSQTPPLQIIQQQVRLGLEEDIGSGDITAELIPDNKHVSGFIVCRESAILCGQAWFEEVFRQLDQQIEIHWYFSDRDQLNAGDRVCSMTGSARPILRDRKSTRLNSSHIPLSRMPSSA